VPREGERIFSTVSRYFAGLPGPKTHEAGRQDFGDFGKALSRVFWMRSCGSHCGRLNEKRRMSRSGNELANSIEPCRKRSQSRANHSCAKPAVHHRYFCSLVGKFVRLIRFRAS
jgi:hypothetical protein